MAETEIFTLPVFENRMRCVGLWVPTTRVGKLRTLADSVKVGTLPVPVKVTTWGLDGSESPMATEPVRAPVAVGMKVTLSAQLEPPASEPPQLFVCAKSPLAVMLPKVMAVVPKLVSVTVRGKLVEFTLWAPKLRVDGATATADPVPVSVMT
jgi:hypothetical protein